MRQSLHQSRHTFIHQVPLLLGIYIYFWSVVYSLYKKIQTELTTGETNQVPLKADYGYEGVFNKA